jgi:hypothetical protein
MTELGDYLIEILEVCDYEYDYGVTEYLEKIPRPEKFRPEPCE